MIEQKYILDDCSAREGHRVFEALGITKMHNSESGKVKMSIEQTEKYIKKVDKYISPIHGVEELWVRQPTNRQGKYRVICLFESQKIERDRDLQKRTDESGSAKIQS